jgi:hypothetical protein
VLLFRILTRPNVVPAAPASPGTKDGVLFVPMKHGAAEWRKHITGPYGRLTNETQYQMGGDEVKAVYTDGGDSGCARWVYGQMGTHGPPPGLGNESVESN